MSETSITERDAILRERAAREGGYAAGYYDGLSSAAEIDLSSLTAKAREHAVKVHRLPPRTEPRVVTDRDTVSWRYVDGHYEWRRADAWPWEILRPELMYLTAERIDLLAALKANPTREVPDDA